MRIINHDIYEGCYETRVYPFDKPDTEPRNLVSNGYIRVLFEGNHPPRIDFNIGLGHMNGDDVRVFQEAINKVLEIAAPAATVASADAVTWTLPSELVTPEVKTVLNRLQEMLVAKGDETGKTIATLQTELAATRAEAARLRAALESIEQRRHISEYNYVSQRRDSFERALKLIVSLGDEYFHEAGRVGINFTLTNMLKAAHEALAVQHPADEGAGE